AARPRRPLCKCRAVNWLRQKWANLRLLMWTMRHFGVTPDGAMSKSHTGRRAGNLYSPSETRNPPGSPPAPAGSRGTRRRHARGRPSSSSSPVPMPSLVHQIADPLALRAAWERVAAGGSTYPGADGVTPAAFAADLDPQPEGLAATHRAGTYTPRPLRRFWLRRPGCAPRPIDVAAVRDRVVQRALLVPLQARLDPLLAEAAFAYRPGRSPEAAARRLAAYCANGHPVVARGDIRAFFGSISHARLLATLDALLGDPHLNA